MSTTRQNLRLVAVIILIVLTASAAILGGLALANVPAQSANLPLTVEDPIQLTQYPVSLSLFPGETVPFNVTLLNSASVNYTVRLVFSVNDSLYQRKYVSFSDNSYIVGSGEQVLSAWVSVSSDAPAAELTLNVSCVRLTDAFPTSTPQPTITATPTPANSSMHPSVQLFEAGAKWASPTGKNALYVDFKDCWLIHGTTDGVNWGPWDSVETMDAWRNATTQALQDDGFNITYVGDVPAGLAGYDLVVIEAYLGVEPKDEPTLRNFVQNGGGLVMTMLTPCMVSVYCKDRWPYRLGGTDLTSFSDWFGYRTYINVGGAAYPTANNLLGTSLSSSQQVFYTGGASAASVANPVGNPQVIAQYDGGTPFAFTHTFGAGRVYWQGHIWPF